MKTLKTIVLIHIIVLIRFFLINLVTILFLKIRSTLELENTERQSKMDNLEKLAPWGTQDEDKQNKNTTHYVLDTTIKPLFKIKRLNVYYRIPLS